MIIEEMLEFADDFREESSEPPVTADRIRDWADRLERSGALVPVPVGDACEISRIAICGCFLFNGTAFRLYSFSCEDFGAWQLSDHTEHLFAHNTIVQPVRLVPIAEAGI